LSKIKKYYEIIVFTSGTKEYADQIIDVIENDEKFFDFRLYREHTLFYNNEFIKDISRIGRPLDKIIIVDNLRQNFRLQKENGIEIKSFFGDDNNDKALVSLGNILKKIANRFNDTRNGIIEYKNEIKNKIS
jgi:CTD small phosphatase-like protein 2